MFAPIRPRPIMPICICHSFFPKRFLKEQDSPTTKSTKVTKKYSFSFALWTKLILFLRVLLRGDLFLSFLVPALLCASYCVSSSPVLRRLADVSWPRELLRRH